MAAASFVPKIGEGFVQLPALPGVLPFVTPSEFPDSSGPSEASGASSADPSLDDAHHSVLEDHSLDALLGRLPQPALASNFTDKVLNAVSPVPVAHVAHVQQANSSWKALASLAALVAVCASSLLLNAPVEKASSPTSDEERLIAALRSPELFTDDLPLVAKLGEILEAELNAPQHLWPSEN